MYQVTKVRTFSFSISSSKEYSGLISLRMDWFDLLADQGTLKSLQHHSSKALILWHSAFFMVQLSHPYTPTGKTIALSRWTFVGILYNYMETESHSMCFFVWLLLFSIMILGSSILMGKCITFIAE